MQTPLPHGFNLQLNASFDDDDLGVTFQEES